MFSSDRSEASTFKWLENWEAEVIISESLGGDEVDVYSKALTMLYQDRKIDDKLFSGKYYI